jgi:hypothetical protein
MKDDPVLESGGNACPKRLWVMLALSDDEALEPDGELPVGLRVHLRHCDSCRSLSSRLLIASGGLRSLAELEPPAGALDRANTRLEDAIRAGAIRSARPPSNGRSRASDHPTLGPTSRPRWTSRASYAAAAALAAAFLGPALWRAAYIDHKPGAALRPAPNAAEAPREVRGFPTTDGTAPRRPRDIEPTAPTGIARRPEPRERLAAGDDDSSPEQTLRPRICTFDSYDVFRGTDDATCIYRGFPLPRQQKSPRSRR